MIHHPQHNAETALIYGHHHYHLKKAPTEKEEKTRNFWNLLLPFRKVSPSGLPLLGQIWKHLIVFLFLPFIEFKTLRWSSCLPSPALQRPPGLRPPVLSAHMAHAPQWGNMGAWWGVMTWGVNVEATAVGLSDSIIHKDTEALSSKALYFVTDYHKYHKNSH